MTESTDSNFIEMLDAYSNDPPATFFERVPTKETTTVRTMHFALKSIVSQLRIPISTEAEAVVKWIVYKQAGPHKHQKFFGFFRQLGRLLKKFNDMGLVKRLNVVLRKAEDCGDDMYKLEPSAIRYMGCAYLKRLFLLDQIRETCVKCADSSLGMLELDHWTNLCLIIVATCAQIHSEVVSQVLEMEKAYKTGVAVFRTVDQRFPTLLTDLQVVQKIKRDSGVFDDRKVDISAVSRLLKYNETRIEEAQTENEIRMKRNEVLNELLATELSLTPAVLPKPVKNAKNPPKTPSLDLSDLGISISREELSFLNSTAQSTSTAIVESEADDDDLLMSPMLFGGKKSAKKPLKKKRKSGEDVDSSTPKVPKIQKTSTSFLASTMSLFDEAEKKLKKKKVKKSKN